MTAAAGTAAAVAAALLAALAPASALAQPAVQPAVQPLTLPSRDVSVRYQVEGEATSLLPGGLPGPVTLSWDAAGARVRAEGQGRNQVAVLNLRTRQGEVFDTGLRLVMPLKLRPGSLDPLMPNGARLTPAGSDTVAGLPCRLYTLGGRGGTVCLSADGIPLRGSGEVEGRPGRFTALAVTYGTTAPALFAPPPGYMQLGGGNAGGLNLQDLGRSLLGGGRP